MKCPTQWFYNLCMLTIFLLEPILNGITPYKYTETENQNGIPAYTIPASSRFVAKRRDSIAPDIVYYLSTPEVHSYSIAFLCTGSSSKNDLRSVIHFHRYFLQECLDMNIGMITVEQWGIDGNTILWSGAGHYTWREELWTFIKHFRIHGSWWLKLLDRIPRWVPFSFNVPKDRYEYDIRMNDILANPTADKEFMGMTYLYHADALQYPLPQYEKIQSPLLVVTGALDTIIQSSDAFVQKAQDAGVHITYMHIPDMDHYIRRRPDILQASFDWLKQHIKTV